MLNQQRLLEDWPAPNDLMVGQKIIVLESRVYAMDRNVGALSNLQSKAAWKDTIQENLNLFCKYLQMRSVWAHCNLCANQHMMEHCGSEKHFKSVWRKVEDYAALDFVVVRDQFWQTWQLLGGGIRFNHLDATVEVFGSGPRPNSSSCQPLYSTWCPASDHISAPPTGVQMLRPPNTIPCSNYTPSASKWGSIPLSQFPLSMQPPSNYVGTQGLSGAPMAVTCRSTVEPLSRAQSPPPVQSDLIETWKMCAELNDEDDWSKLCDEFRAWGGRAMQLDSSVRGRSGGRFKVAVRVELEWDRRRPAFPSTSRESSLSYSPPIPPVRAMPPTAPPPMAPIVPSEPSSDGGAQNSPLFAGDRVIVDWYGQMHEAASRRTFCLL